MNASIALASMGRCPGCTKRVPLVRSIDAWQSCPSCEWEWRLHPDGDHVAVTVRQPRAAVEAEVVELERARLR